MTIDSVFHSNMSHRDVAKKFVGSSEEAFSMLMVLEFSKLKLNSCVASREELQSNRIMES